MKRPIVLFVLAAFVVGLSQAQEFTIKRVELAGDKVNLYYDLIDSVKSRTYTIDLYSSKDNFISKLEKVSGDLGLEVKPGGNHKIVWNAKEELGSLFSGKIGLEVRGRVYIPFVRLEGLKVKYKKGKEFPMIWTGGTQQNILNFDLYKGDELEYSFANIANVGQTTFKFPKSVKPAKNYYFKVSDTRNKDQIVITSSFKIKRKVPLWLFVIPVGSAAYLVLTAPGSGSADMPDPLPPPGGGG
jgi:hypothetical protein